MAEPADYADPTHWLCRPGQHDTCAETLTATIFAADGGQSKASYAPNADAPVDCFYVYPTVSREPAPIADLALEETEKHAAEEQFSRFSGVCREYAPLYRQITLSGLRAAFRDNGGNIDFDMPYRDVLEAWRHYLAHDNQGRGVILIGHSQGSVLLLRLLAAEIDGKPVAAQLVSAIITGTEIDVPAGKLVGGSLKAIPLCASADEAGCVIGYSSFLAASPPGDHANFGMTDTPGMVDACVNPAALTDDGALDSELPAVGPIGGSFGTTFVENPGLLTARCVTDDKHSYLAISIASDLRGAIVGAGFQKLDTKLPGWGLHALDLNLALGNLVEIAGRQSKTWLARHPSASP